MSAGYDYERNPSSQCFVGSRKFIKVDTPVVGAILVRRDYINGGKTFNAHGHVTFIFAQHGNKFVCLGGNQNHRIKFSEYNKIGFEPPQSDGSRQKNYAIYVPISYYEQYKIDVKRNDLPTFSENELNRLAGINSGQIGPSKFSEPTL
jgi:hypothetical protein